MNTTPTDTTPTESEPTESASTESEPTESAPSAMMTIDSFVDKIFVINLDRDVDRWTSMVEQFKKHSIENYERVPGVLVTSADGFQLWGAHFGDDSSLYDVGSVGCLLAHKKALRLAQARNYRRFLVLEDDAILCDDFGERFGAAIQTITEKNLYWDLLYLGLERTEHYPNNTIIHPGIMQVKDGGCCAHAYILSRSAVNLCLINIDYQRQEFDLMLNNLIMAGKLNTLMIHPSIVKQSTAFCSNISTRRRYLDNAKVKEAQTV